MKMNSNGQKSKVGYALVGAILFILIAAIVLGAITYRYVGRDMTTQLNDGKAETPNGSISNDGAVIGECVGTGVALMSASISPADYEEYGVSPMAESAYTITATLSPEIATNKNVTWSVAWSTASSSWANGKDVTDYVSISPSDLACTVSCLQAFGEQAVIKCSWAENEEINASCTVDYAKRITSLNYAHNDVAYSFTASGASYEYSGENGEYVAFEDPWLSPIYGAYTADDLFSYSYFISFSESLVNAMQEQGFETLQSDMTYNVANMDDTFFGASGGMFGVFVLKSEDAQSVVADRVSGGSGAYNKFATAMRELEGETLFTIDVVCEGTYSSFTGSCNFSAAASVYAINVTNIALNESSLIF